MSRRFGRLYNCFCTIYVYRTMRVLFDCVTNQVNANYFSMSPTPMRSVFLILTRRRKTWVQTLSHLIQHRVYAMHLSQKQKHSPTTCLENTLSANAGRPTWSLLFKISDTPTAPTGKTLICIQGLALSLNFLADSFLQCTCWWTPATVPKGVATNRKNIILLIKRDALLLFYA
jgi:hypothetical protein